ncbi:MAG TPA: NAD(P)(+) transhydrogenase (Re/Si-specific) subunit alpha, partial [Bacteroidia bacterium]|nr:NAD(P)(+) transhydrogenase (Re/Si-specific) subunit alpha [Bacteroidia bacterium]
MKVGIPSEIFPNELRVAATPKTVKRLQKQGFEVYIQQNAGARANFSDKEFEEAGAKIVPTAADIYGKMDIVLKVKEPSMEEVDMMREGLVTLSYLWPAQNQPLLQKLADKKVNAVAMDAIPRISRAQKMDVL